MGRSSGGGRRVCWVHVAPLALGLASGCAAGADGPPTTAAATGEPSTTGSSGTSGETTGVGASTTSTGEGGGAGAGGPTTGTGASGPGSGGAGAGTSTGTGAGGPGSGGASSTSVGAGAGGSGSGGAGGAEPTGVITLLAVGPTSGVEAVRSPQGVWSSTAFNGAFSASRPALAMLGPSAALGLVRLSSDALHHTVYDGVAWSALVSIGAGTTTRDTPALASSVGVAHATFHGLSDFRHYYARYDGAFSLLGETVGGVGNPSFGPSAASVTAIGNQPLVAYAGDDDGLYGQQRGNATWLSAQGVALGGLAVDVTPAVTALGSGDPLVVATTSSTTVVWARRQAGTWSAATAVAVDALSNDPPALAPIEGGAVLAYRGTNGGVYAATFDMGTGTWSAPERVAGAATTPSTPAVAPGVDGASAELAFVDGSSGAARHVRLTAGAWGAPSTVGGSNLTGVAIATPP